MNITTHYLSCRRKIIAQAYGYQNVGSFMKRLAKAVNKLKKDNEHKTALGDYNNRQLLLPAQVAAIVAILGPAEDRLLLCKEEKA